VARNVTPGGRRRLTKGVNLHAYAKASFIFVSKEQRGSRIATGAARVKTYHDRPIPEAEGETARPLRCDVAWSRGGLDSRASRYRPRAMILVSLKKKRKKIYITQTGQGQ